MIIEITDKVEFDLNDDESLPLTKCVCGKKFEAWNFIIGVDKDKQYMKQCSACGRFLFWELTIKVFEYKPQIGLKKEVSNEETKD